MTIALSSSQSTDIAANALVLAVMPAARGKVDLAGPRLPGAVARRVLDALQTVGATGNCGQVTKIPAPTGMRAQIVVGVGVGDQTKQTDREAVRRAIGDAIRSLT
ncbi:MAG: M17 family peptidase N-terminal domain-containing protein, partial [Actinomycetales bacterium]